MLCLLGVMLTDALDHMAHRDRAMVVDDLHAFKTKMTPASSQNKNVSASGQVHEAVDKPNPGKAPLRKVLIAGDSLLNRMYISKMKVSDIPSVKLTKRGNNLSGTIS